MIVIGRRSDSMVREVRVRALVGDIVLGKTLNSHSAPLHPGV